MDVRYPVALDPDYEVWNAFGTTTGRPSTSPARTAGSGTTSSAKVATTSASRSCSGCYATRATRASATIWSRSSRTASRSRPTGRISSRPRPTSARAGAGFASPAAPCSTAAHLRRARPARGSTSGRSRASGRSGAGRASSTGRTGDPVPLPRPRRPPRPQRRVNAGRPIRFQVLVDGEPPGDAHGLDVEEDGSGTVAEQRLYQLVRQPGPIEDRTLRDRLQRARGRGLCLHVRLAAGVTNDCWCSRA